MDLPRPRSSRPRKRSEPLIARPLSQDSDSDTVREFEAEYQKLIRPQTAAFRPASSRSSSGTRGLKFSYNHASSDADDETDTETIKAVSPKQDLKLSARARDSSGVRSTQRNGKSNFSNINTESEKLEVGSPEQPRDCVNDEIAEFEAKYPLHLDFEDVPEMTAPETSEQIFLPPIPAMNYSDVRSNNSDREYSQTPDSDGGETVILAEPRRKKSSICLRPEKTVKHEPPKVPKLMLDDTESVVSKATVLLKSAHGKTDLKNREKRHVSGSRLSEQLKKIDMKNMLFFPSKNLTRPSIEEIYGPVKKRSTSNNRQSNPLKSLSSNNIDKGKLRKTPIEKDTPRCAATKESNKACEPEPKRNNEPKILAPLLIKRTTDKRAGRIRPAGPVVAKPFVPSGPGKGIPPLKNLPKPKVGVIPSFLQDRKKNDEVGNLRSRSLSVLEKKVAKNDTTVDALKGDKKSILVQSNKKKSDDLFMRNRIPLRKTGSQSTSNLIPSISYRKKDNLGLKPKKSVTFDVPPSPDTKKQVESKRDTKMSNNTSYEDPERRKYTEYFENLPVFDDGPLPITEPSPLYKRIKEHGWDFSLFTPKNKTTTVPTIPYDFLEHYLHVFNNDLERTAVHTKYGSATVCTCDQPGTSSDFCEKHVDVNKLQYYQEAAEVMICILSVKYEVPEFEEVEKMLEKSYPFYYRGYILEKPTKLSIDYRVREAKCKYELVKCCKRILKEEQLLAEFMESDEEIGKKRDIKISGRMRNLNAEFESAYTFLFLEYPHLFVQLVQKIEFMPLAIERKTIGVLRSTVVAKSKKPEELQKADDYYREQLESEAESEA